VLQPIDAFVRHAAAAAAVASARQTNVANFCAPRCKQAPAQLTPSIGHGYAKIIL